MIDKLFMTIKLQNIYRYNKEDKTTRKREDNMELHKLREKAQKRIGKKAVNTKYDDVFGKTATILDVEVQSSNGEFKLLYVLDYGDFTLVSAEKDTLIYLDNN